MSGSGNGGGQRPPAANPDSLFQRMAKAFGGIPGALSELYSDLGPKGFGLILLAFLAGIVLTNFRPSWLVFGYEPEPGGSGAAEVVSVEPEASFSFDRKEENGQDLVTIEPALQWVTSGVWSADGKNLYLVGSHRALPWESATASRLLVLNPKEKKVEYIRRAAELRPVLSGIEGIGVDSELDSLFLQLRDLTIHRVDESIKSFETIDLGRARHESGTLIDNIRSNIAYTDSFYAFLAESPCPNGQCNGRPQGGCALVSHSWAGTFVRVSQSNEKQLSFLASVDVCGDNWPFYSLGFPLVAAAGKEIFLLSAERYPCVLKARSDQGTATCWWEIEDDLMSIPAWSSGATGYQSTRNLLMSHKLVVGLYAWESNLYLLVRGGEDRFAKTSWTLIKLQGSDTDVIASAERRLPTESPYITLVPGTKHWAIVEHTKFPDSRDADAIRKIILIDANKVRNGREFS